jgi:hypothetical protein
MPNKLAYLIPENDCDNVFGLCELNYIKSIDYIKLVVITTTGREY